MSKTSLVRVHGNNEPLVRAEIADKTQFKNPEKGRLIFTVDAVSLKLDKLVTKNSSFFSEDKKGSRRDIAQLYRDIGRKSPAQFACITARTYSTSASLLSAYAAPSPGLKLNESAVVLVADLKQIKDDLIIFAGDVQGLAEKRREHDLEARMFQVKLSELAAKLEQLPGEQVPGQSRGIECLRGPYFEARLARALRPTDLIAIYIDKDDQRVFKRACQIMKMKFQMTQSVGIAEARKDNTLHTDTIPLVCLF